MRLQTERKISEHRTLWSLFLYHPESYLSLKHYSRRYTWTQCLTAWCQSSRYLAEHILCARDCQNKHFYSSPSINAGFLLLHEPTQALIKTSCQNKMNVSEWCGQHGAEKRSWSYCPISGLSPGTSIVDMNSISDIGLTTSRLCLPTIWSDPVWINLYSLKQ